MVIRVWNYWLRIGCMVWALLAISTSLAQVSLENGNTHYRTNNAITRSTVSQGHNDMEAKDIDWTSCGPVKKADEGIGGGRAIPHFAVGRGNGIGRINAMYIHPKATQMLYASSVTGGMFISSNFGSSWQSAGTDELNPSGVGAFGVHHLKSNWWVIANGDHENQLEASSHVMLTTDGGKTYQPLALVSNPNGLSINGIENSEEAFVIHKILWDPVRKNRIWLVTNNGVWISDVLRLSKRGRLLQSPKWTCLLSGDFFDLIFQKKGNKVEWLLTSDKILRSTDWGKNWIVMENEGWRDGIFGLDYRMTLQTHKNLPNFVFTSVTSSATSDKDGRGISVLYLVDIKNESWQILHLDETLNKGPSGLRPKAWAVNPKNHNHIVLADVSPVYYSFDGGKNFNKSVANLMHDDTHHLCFAADGRAIFAAHDGGISVSYDDGLHWTDKSLGLECANIFGVACNPTQREGLLYGAYDTGINYLSDHEHKHLIWGDGFDCDFLAQSNRAVATIQDGSFLRADSNLVFEGGKHPGAKSEWRTHMSVHPNHSQCVFVSGKKLMRSLDAGETWQAVFDTKQDTLFTTIFDFFISEFDKNTGIAYAQTKNGRYPQLIVSHNILQSKQGEMIWHFLPQIEIQANVVAIVFHPIQKNQFWLLTSSVDEVGKLWFFNGKDYQDVSANLGKAKCESLIVNREKFALLIGSNQGVFCKDLYELNFKKFTGYPHCAVKCMDINYQSQQLYIGTFGRGIWRCALDDFE